MRRTVQRIQRAYSLMQTLVVCVRQGLALRWVGVCAPGTRNAAACTQGQAGAVCGWMLGLLMKVRMRPLTRMHAWAPRQGHVLRSRRRASGPLSAVVGPLCHIASSTEIPNIFVVLAVYQSAYVTDVYVPGLHRCLRLFALRFAPDSCLKTMNLAIPLLHAR